MPNGIGKGAAPPEVQIAQGGALEKLPFSDTSPSKPGSGRYGDRQKLDKLRRSVPAAKTKPQPGVRASRPEGLSADPLVPAAPPLPAVGGLPGELLLGGAGAVGAGEDPVTSFLQGMAGDGSVSPVARQWAETALLVLGDDAGV